MLARSKADPFEDLFDGGGLAELEEVFSVPGMPTLPALKPRYGEPLGVMHPLWPSTPEPGLVETLQAACVAYAEAEAAEVPASGRRSRRRRRRAGG